MSKEIKLLHVVPSLTEETYELVEVLWSSYRSEYCHNYDSLSQQMDSSPDRDTLKNLLDPFKKLGLVKTVHGLMTDDGEVAGSGFCVNGIEAEQLLELAMFRYNYNDNPMGKSEDYIPKQLTVGGYKYRLLEQS